MNEGTISILLMVADSTIFVSAFTPHEVLYSRASRFVDDVFKGNHRIVEPTIFQVEVVAALTRRFKQRKYDLRTIQNVNLQITSTAFISWRIIDRAYSLVSAIVAMQYGLRGMDAIYAATAIEYELPLLTEDLEFKKANLPIPILSLSDLIK